MEQFTILPLGFLPVLLLLCYSSLASLSNIVPKAYQIFGESSFSTILSLMQTIRPALYFLPL
jgi:ATP synthase subunit 6